MKLDRNVNFDGRGKYALINLRKLEEIQSGVTFGTPDRAITRALTLLEERGILDQVASGTESEFFVIKLKDRHALPALMAYGADVALHGDAEYASER